jgi:uncharacterized protein YuzE
MEISYDKQADALSIWFNGVASDMTVDITDDILIDIDDSGRLAGIEVLHASEKANLPDLLTLTLKLFPDAKEFRVQIPNLIDV